MTNDFKPPKMRITVRPERWYEHPNYVDRWLAEIDGGGWYDDSNPYALGDTRKEAIANILAKAKEMATELNNLTEKDVVE